jgi:DNA-binding NarL/FixJ family response regulator
VDILIAEDHALVLEGLTLLLEQEPDFRVVAGAADGFEAVELALRHRPLVAVLDLGLPGLNGVEVAVRLRECVPETRVLALSMHRDGHLVRRMLDAGASGYVLKESAAGHLRDAIRTVARGGRYFGPGLGYQDAARDSADAGLSPREREVLQAVAEGLRTAAVAERLGLSVKTVETYRRRLMGKLGVDTVTGLVVFALRHGYVTLDELPDP